MIIPSALAVILENKKLKSFKKYLQSSIEQKTLLIYGFRKPDRILFCPYCGGNLEFVIRLKKPPPEILKSQKELFNEISCNF